MRARLSRRVTVAALALLVVAAASELEQAAEAAE
jgi:hypothetical protein